MKLAFRFIFPVIVITALIAYFIIPVVDTLSLRWYSHDIELRSELLTSTISPPLADYLEQKQTNKINRLFSQAIQDERLVAIGFCSPDQKFLNKTFTFPATITCDVEIGTTILTLASGKVLVYSYHVKSAEDNLLGNIVLVHDLSYIKKRSSATKTYLMYLFLVLGIIISLIVFIIVKMSLWGWLRSLQNILHITENKNSQIKGPSEFSPFIKDLKHLITKLKKESYFRDEATLNWNSGTLKDILHKELFGDEVIVVSNREPYIHQQNGSKVDILFPASGVVTALEPIMKACSGTWIAHGSGNADKDFVDQNNSIRVPPDNPKYKLRRVWLSKEEEQGYYYGFSNEGLWPLCHIAHVRPTFRDEDWKYYQQVNLKFAQVVLQESRTKDPIILIQDYHFALLPQMIRKLLPQATVITFWHIPWPNSESFGICPWKEQILDGLLGSSILGFHTPYHCSNFLDSVDRYLECRIDRASSNILYNQQLTSINYYPISIEPPLQVINSEKKVIEKKIKQELNILEHVSIGVGVDRLDYTKGIIERFLSIKTFFQKNPNWKNRFTFIQIGAPSRTDIPAYKAFSESVNQLAQTINNEIGNESWKPIVLIAEHRKKEYINLVYQISDLCFVSSLHDGMNLVAKEYVSMKGDDTGVLLLSQFAGAAIELPEALIVNPYDIFQCSEAIKLGLEMPVAEQKARMRSMRLYVTEFNVYRWAGKMLIDSSQIRRREKIIKTRI